MLANVTLYWLTNTAATSIRHYYEDTHHAAAPSPGPTTVPLGLAAAADGDFRSIRRFAERDHARITSWTSLPGVTGHYSAYTNPDQLAADIQRFFRPLRPAATARGDMTAMPAQTWNIITESLDLLRDAAAAISDADLEAPTPCAQWTVAQVLQHAAGDQLAWAAALGTGTGPTENPFEPSGLIKAGIDDFIAPALATARAAWAGVRRDDDAVATPLPQGPLQARVAAGACALDAAVHAWDIAVALGRPGFLPSSLAAQLLPAAQAVVEPLRPFAYAAALAPQPDDDAAGTLLRYLGRDPQWQAAGKEPR